MINKKIIYLFFIYLFIYLFYLLFFIFYFLFFNQNLYFKLENWKTFNWKMKYRLLDFIWTILTFTYVHFTNKAHFLVLALLYKVCPIVSRCQFQIFSAFFFFFFFVHCMIYLANMINSLST